MTVEALRARIAELEKAVASLDTTHTDWLTEERTNEIHVLVQDLLADADARASLLAANGTAGWDNGFFLASADGNFHLNISGQAQFRYMISIQDDGPGVDSTRGGFENSRTKLIFSGNVVDPSWVYRIEGNFSRDGGSFGLEDAYVGKAFDNGWTFLAGQFKAPVLREELVYGDKQLAVERSLVNEEFTAGRVQGVALDYRNDQFHFIGGYTDGHPASGGFNRPALASDTEYALTARGEILFSGHWSQFDDLTSWKGEDFGFMLGGAVHYESGEYGTAADEAEVLEWTLDASLEFGGANVLGYFVGRHLKTSVLDLDQYGFVIQGGFFVNDDWELFARYEWGDDDVTSDDLGIITFGANRYFSGHQLKWTMDVGYAFDAVSATFGDGLLGEGGSITGWRTDAAENDGQLVIRTQLQLLF